MRTLANSPSLWSDGKCTSKVGLERAASPPGVSSSPEVELVVTTAGGGNGETSVGDGFSLAEFSDHLLQEKIQRLSTHITSGITGRLPDRGEKLRSNLRQLQDELARRVLARAPNENDSGSGDQERVKRSKSTQPSGSFNDSNPNTTSSGLQSSFALRFSEMLEDKANDAFSEELRLVSRDKDKGSREMLSKPTTTLTRGLPSQFLANKSEQKFSIDGCRDIESSSISSLNPGRKICKRPSNRRRGSKYRGSLDWEFKKVQDVVLLDDEDVQLTQPIQGEMPDEWKESNIYYPSRNDPESVEISYSDLNCLDPESYLSSTIMNFYIQYLQRSLSSIGRPMDEYLIFNTYFYKKLVEAVSCKGDRTACFSKLRRWWKGVNIFQKGFILLPIHGDMHWSLVIICIPAKEDESGPVILHLDSLGLHSSNQVFDIVHSYLKEEWKYIKQNGPPPDLPISKRIWKNLPRRIEKKKVKVPQQKNEYDCGLFVLYYMERFIGVAPNRLRKKDLAMFDSKWFKPEEASGLRKRIRELLVEEFENNSTRESPASSGSSESDKR